MIVTYKGYVIQPGEHEEIDQTGAKKIVQGCYIVHEATGDGFVQPGGVQEAIDEIDSITNNKWAKPPP